MSWDSLIMKSQIATGEIMPVLLIPILKLDGVLLDVIVDVVIIEDAVPVIIIIRNRLQHYYVYT